MAEIPKDVADHPSGVLTHAAVECLQQLLAPLPSGLLGLTQDGFGAPQVSRHGYRLWLLAGGLLVDLVPGPLGEFLAVLYFRSGGGLIGSREKMQQATQE